MLILLLPDDLNVVIPADAEPLLASVVGSCVTLLAVVETSEVRATVFLLLVLQWWTPLRYEALLLASLTLVLLCCCYMCCCRM